MRIPWIFAAIVLATGAHAQDPQSLGALEYSNNCVQCHGSDGKGGGTFAQYLTKRPPSLTTLSRSNDGVFPVTRVHEIIDGTSDVALHGGREMPLWGNRYRASMQSEATAHYSAEEAQRYAMTRVLSLIEYLASIQED